LEIGVTLAHPHGQIDGYPFVTPETAAAIRSVLAYRAATGADLFADLLAGELQDGSRIVGQNEHWVALVPFAARWPVEVHLYPRVRCVISPNSVTWSGRRWPSSTWRSSAGWRECSRTPCRRSPGSSR
jgi:galactose-1-phosphate uridylyltransferase